MKNIAWHLTAIALLIAGFVYLLTPPKESLRLGRDLRGGVSLIYAVDIPQGADNARVLGEVINVLKSRANPTGTLDISFVPQGYNRIEVVMPLPSPEVQQLQMTFRQTLEALVSSSRVEADEIEVAAQAGTAVQRFGGSDETRRGQLAMLEAEARRALLARQALESAIVAQDEAAQRASLAEIAEAEVALEQGAESLATTGLTERRMMRALALPVTPQPLRDAVTGRTKLDERGNALLGPSEREEELAAIRAEYPSLAVQLDRTIEAWRAYEARRGGLDSPEDLKRLFRGAGVLDFHIAVDARAPEGVNVDELRKQLAERGPENTDSIVARWFKVNDLKQWAQTADALMRLRADPTAFFAERGLAAATFEGDVYLLLYTTEQRSLVHAPDNPWAMRGASETVDELGRPAVAFALDTRGGELMGRLTVGNVGKPMAIVLDGQVYTAPNLQTTIRDQGRITGSFSPEDIKYLTRVLAAGTLSGQLSPEPISVNVLGPALGSDNLVRGLRAVLFSVIAVAILMLGYYLMAGVMANLSLAFIILVIFGMMAFIDSTFTMPGLAGIALAIGMAVDANVLIFERMREEIMINKEPLRNAARLGFRRAFSAIFDGNVTNLMVCIVLIWLAGTEVKGFGVTMMIGSFATLLGGVWVTRVLMSVYTEWMGARRLPMIATVFPAVNRWIVPRVDWIRLRPLLFGISLVLAVGGLGLAALRGGDLLDTEFRGGVALTMTTRRVDTVPYTVAAGDTFDRIAAKAVGVPAAALAALNPGVDPEAPAPGTVIRVPSGPSSMDGRMLLGRAEVEQRLQAKGREAPEQSVIGQFRSATVLTLGDQTPDFRASSFQVKVGNPPGQVDESTITSEAVTAVAATFAEDLDAQLSRTFKGSGGSHTDFTRPIDKRTIGEVIGRPEITDAVGRLRGGVALMIDQIEPPITVDDASTRVQRLRTQPDFADVGGRDMRVVGLDLADADHPERGYRSVAILVGDPAVNLPKVPIETWDTRLARREWQLVSQALAQETSLDQVASFSPSVAQSLLANAVIAICLSLILMLGYIWLRFGSLRYSLGTILSLTFNICVCLGFLGASGLLAGTSIGAALGIQEFRIDLNVVAGLLAILGYDVNDSIVILDRVRERRGRMAYASKQVVNDAINQTFSRTILTSGTTILSALILVIYGGESIRPFTMTLLVGLIAGTFSSIAIAAPLVYAARREEASSTPPAQAAGAAALPHPV